MSVDDFIRVLAEAVALRVQQVTAATPPKTFDVSRQGPQGPMGFRVTLPQAITDLTDELRKTGEINERLRLSNLALIGELERHRKLVKKMIDQKDDL